MTVRYLDLEMLAKAVKQHRFVEMGIDLREAAKQIGTSAATLSRIENGCPCEINTFLNVCHWLKSPLTQFVKTKKHLK